jgi:hypothetical protein
VDDSLCDQEEVPAAARVCVLPCPGDCVVAPWGPWTSCSHPCGPRRPDGRQTRTRSVVALPGQGERGVPATGFLIKRVNVAEARLKPFFIMTESLLISV